MAMSFLRLDFLTLAMKHMGVLKHVCTKHTPTHATHRQPALHSPLKPQRVKYNQSSLTMLSWNCLGALTETQIAAAR